MKFLNNIKNLKNKRVLVRVDFNVPISKGKVVDDTRIKESLKTIRFLKKKKAKIILMSHLGRPEGKVNKEYSLEPVAKHLSKLLNGYVSFVDECIGEDIEYYSENLKQGDVLVLENLRFHKEEKKNEKKFAKALARLADVYVNDAFGTCHRAHASVHTITKFLPSYAGFLLEKEVNVMQRAIAKPKKPFVAIIGGVKLETKIPVIENFLKKADHILIGGAMMFTFYKAMGLEIGKSKFDEKELNIAKKILKKGKDKLVLPVDTMTDKRIVDFDKMNKNEAGLDIGPKSIKLFKGIISKAKTVVWNGPLGLFEKPKYARGTFEIAKALAKSKAVTIAGGGDSVAAISKLKLNKKFSHISTGGGASLELMSGKKLPGLAVLD